MAVNLRLIQSNGAYKCHSFIGINMSRNSLKHALNDVQFDNGPLIAI